MKLCDTRIQSGDNPFPAYSLHWLCLMSDILPNNPDCNKTLLGFDQHPTRIWRQSLAMVSKVIMLLTDMKSFITRQRNLVPTYCLQPWISVPFSRISDHLYINRQAIFLMKRQRLPSYSESTCLANWSSHEGPNFRLASIRWLLFRHSGSGKETRHSEATNYGGAETFQIFWNPRNAEK